MREHRRKRRGAALAVYSILITLASVLLLLLSLFLVNIKNKNEEKIAETDHVLEEVSDNLVALEKENEELEADNKFLNETSTGAKFRAKLKSMFQSGSSTIQVLKYLFPDEIVLTDEGSFYFYEISDDLKKNSYKDENFILNDSNEIEYAADGETISIKGIDISKHNGEIDWEKVAASGVKFAFIRCGIRGYGSGEIVADDNFQKNVEGAAANGIQVGTYFFSQAVSANEAREEAEFVLNSVSQLSINCPIAIDVEKVEGVDSVPRTNGLSSDQYTENVLEFCNTISEAGYTPMIYGNIKSFARLLNMDELEDIQKWFAGYVSEDSISPYFPYEFRVWQYSSTGKVDGISGDVDMNIAFY
ncbi:MAG: glycoside hydrolase family 25 protein [Lachnospiraceae bacterium]|nr:glycoside hydrolase family 25 protein [Lachnospiraceae bacterium]